MDTLARLIDRRPPVEPGMACAAVAERFAAEPEAAVLAVVEGGRPVGLIGRDVLAARLAGGMDPKAPVSQAMDADPLIAPAHTAAAPFRDQAAGERPGSLLRGFIATDDGRYAGVGTALSLLGARRARELPEPLVMFGEQINAELMRHLDGVDDFAGRLSRLPLAPDAKAFARAITETGQDLRRMLEQTARLYRADIGLMELVARPRRLREVMDGVEQAWKDRATAAGVTLLVSLDGEADVAAELDGERLAELFDCLVGRAIAESRRGVVEASLRARPGPEGLVMEGRVRDCGRTLSPGQLAHIFDPMASEPTTELSIRLGMALANRIIQAMAGVIRAEGNVGAGVTVTFDLIAPLAQAAARDKGEDGGAGRAAHILIVDDNATNRMVAEALCEMFDCTSESAADGIEALEAVKARRFDLILMDIKMPRMDGIEATRAIRAMEGEAARTPIIALTANADPEDVRGYLAAGMNDVVEKPIKPERLLAALDAVLPAEDDESAVA